MNELSRHLRINSTINRINKPWNNLLLTNVGYFISHHVFIVVDSGVWNISLVCQRHDVQFLKRMMCKKCNNNNNNYEDVYSRCFYSMLGLTIWTLIPCWGLFIEARDWRKGSMAGSESCPQLISIRTFTLLSNAADLMASSIKGQYLLSETIQS